MFAALALVAPAAAPAAAAPSSRPAAFALSPVGGTGALRLNGARGRVLHAAVSLHNVTGRLVTVEVRRADIASASNGNADYVTGPVSRAGRWLHLGTTQVRLAPWATRTVGFTVRVPLQARGASHYAGIVAVDRAELTASPGRRRSRRKTFAFRRINRQALPLTVRLPGPLFHRMAVRSVRLVVQPVGASLELGLAPEGTELVPGAQVRLRVSRDGHRSFAYRSSLGQLFPGAVLPYRIRWRGRPTPGAYRVQGIVRPIGAPAVRFDRTVRFSSMKATELARRTPSIGGGRSFGLAAWVWLALGVGVGVLLALTVTVLVLCRRPRLEPQA